MGRPAATTSTNFGTLPTERRRDRDAARRPRVRGRGRREQPRAVQLDPREGLRDGHVRPEDRVADHRRARAGADDRLDGAPGRGEHRPLQAAGSRSPTRSSSSRSGPSAWARSSSSRCWPTRRCTARTSPTRPTSTSSRARARCSRTSSAPWFGTFFWIFGSISLVLVALGVVDYVARLVADVLKTLHLRDNERWSESQDLHRASSGRCACVGCAVLLVGLRPAARAARARRRA